MTPGLHAASGFSSLSEIASRKLHVKNGTQQTRKTSACEGNERKRISAYFFFFPTSIFILHERFLRFSFFPKYAPRKNYVIFPQSKTVYFLILPLQSQWHGLNLINATQSSGEVSKCPCHLITQTRTFSVAVILVSISGYYNGQTLVLEREKSCNP